VFDVRIFILPLMVVSIFLSSTVQSYAEAPLPPELELAFEEAKTNDKLRVSYTMSFQWKDVTTRYDASTQTWTPLSGDIKTLGKIGTKKFKTWKRVESKPGGLTYTDYRSSIKNAVKHSENHIHILYRFTSPQTPASLEEALAFVDTELAIDKNKKHLARYAIRAKKSFKPNAVTKLEAFEFDQKFERLPNSGPAVMVYSYWRAKGHRAFSQFDEEYTVRFYDFAVLHESD